MKEINWVEKRNTRFEQASFTWLAYQFMGYVLRDNRNKNTVGCIANMFNCHGSVVSKLWRKLLLE